MRKGTGWFGAFVALTVFASVAHAKDLGDILLKKGLITEEELKQAREEDKQKTAADESRREAILAKIPKWLDAIGLFGDLRTREEGFYANDFHARNRFRIRARVGLNANVTDEIGATVRLASGDPNDPISTNRTLDSVFARKQINLDWAYLTLKPGKTFNLEPGWATVYAGKFGINAYRNSELVWDDDVSPEGATESLNLWERRSGFLRGFRVNAFEWVIDEIGADKDPWIGGGQLVTDTELGSVATWTAAFADYNYINFNKVAANRFNAFNDPPTNAKANANFNSTLAGENSNSLSKDANGKILGYKSGFNVVNGTTELNFPDPVGLGIPAGVFGDVAYNTQADGRNVGFYTGIGIGNAGKDWYHNGLKNKGDWGLSYTYLWVEKDAVLSILTYSDITYQTRNGRKNSATQGGGTNVDGHIFRLDYEPFTNVQLTAKVHLLNALDRKISNAALVGDPTLVRTQFDAVIKF